MGPTLLISLILHLILGSNAESPLDCKADIAFVVDSSSSIHRDDFIIQKEFIKDVVSKFEIGPNDVQISAVSYSRSVYDEFEFNTYNDKAGVLSGVDNIEYSHGTATRTYAAIARMRDNLFAAGNGMRPDVVHVGIVLTDGTTNSGGVESYTYQRGKQETLTEAAKTRNENIFLFAVGIGQKVSNEELRGIATDPDNKFVITVSDYKQLNTEAVKSLIAYRACVAPTTQAPVITTPVPTTTTEKEQKEDPNEVCQGKAADIIFILDESTSIHNQSNFNKELDFVSKTIDFFDLSPGKTQVGVITFSTDAHMIFHLNDFSTKEEIMENIMNIKMHGGDTYTEKALQMLLDEGFSSDYGARSGIAQIAVIVTDGNPTDKYTTRSVATQVLARGITVFAIGVGDVSVPELQRMASNPSEKYVFSVENLGMLNTIKNQLAYTTCKEKNTVEETSSKQYEKIPGPPPCQRQVADIMILADSSTTIGDKDFARQMEFIEDLVDHFDISPEATQIGLITFSDDAHIEFNLNDYSTKTDIQTALTKVKYRTGDTYTDKALYKMLNQGFSSSAGARGREVPMIGIVITDGLSTDPGTTEKMANLVQKKGVMMFSIGVGQKVAEDELKAIASDPDDSHLFMVNNYQSLSSIDGFVSTQACSVLQQERPYKKSLLELLSGLATGR